jgi:tRNA threonylcarbamoyladenosine modification (KEOPS) complex  Pcc1 subunit
MNQTARVRIKLRSKEELSAVFKALQPETRSPVTGRSKVWVGKNAKTLTLTMVFEAKDTSALRAALNSYLHWVRLAVDAIRSVEAP